MSHNLAVGGSVVGALAFTIGLGLVTFKVVTNRREQAVRRKEMAATLAKTFDHRSGSDPIGSPRKGDGAASTHGSTLGSISGASQKELSRAGTAMLDDGELTVIGHNGSSRPTTPSPAHSKSSGGRGY